MVCIFCDTPREEHSAPDLAECQNNGAQQGWIGLSQF
jgi:hypothetical protein